MKNRNFAFVASAVTPIALMLLAANPAATRAALVLTNTLPAGSFNFHIVAEHDATSSKIRIVDTPSIPANGIFGVANNSLAVDSYDYSQSGGVANLNWSVFVTEDGSPQADASASGSIEFTPTTDETYSWTSHWNTAGEFPHVSFRSDLQDQVTGSSVILFSDQNVAFANHTGTLFAGHPYVLDGGVRVSEENLGGGQISASADFTFIATEIPASPTPEPGSLTLLCLGLASFGVVACRKTWQRLICVRDGSPASSRSGTDLMAAQIARAT